MRWRMASALKEIAARLGIGLIFKTLLRQGEPHQPIQARAAAVGLGKGAGRVLPRCGKNLGPTSRHRRFTLAEQCAPVAEVVGPCPADPGLSLPPDRSPGSPRRKTGRVVKVKKGQFPRPLGHEETVVAKLVGAGQIPNIPAHRARRQLRLQTPSSSDMRALPIPGPKTGWPGRLRRHSFRAAGRAGRGGLERRRAALRAGVGPGGG